MMHLKSGKIFLAVLSSLIILAMGCSDDVVGNGEENGTNANQTNQANQTNNHGGADAGDVGNGGDDTDLDADNQSNQSTNHNNSTDPDTGVPDTGDPDSGDSDLDTGDPDTGDPDAGDPYDPDLWTCTGTYQLLCDDECVSSKVDPDNCGECDNICDVNQACAGGECMETCLATETICDRRCVDLDHNNDHCGACGEFCDDGEGCVDGACVPALTFDTPTWCVGGGAPIEFDLDDDDRCSGDVAESTFRWAMCVCDEARFTGGGGIFTDAFDSSLGPYVPGILGGSIGLNNDLTCNGLMNIGGSAWVGNTSGLSFGGGTVKNIATDLNVGGNASISSGATIGRNANIGGNLSGNTPLSIEETLTIPLSSTLTGNATYGQLVRDPVTVQAPCNCEDDDLVPIDDLIADRQFNNDNALIGLDPDALLSGSYQRLDLPCGNYYLNGITSGGSITIVAHGRTALFIDGPVTPGDLTILATPEAELDVFANAQFQPSSLVFGSPHYPAATRLYVGGTDGIHINSGVLIGGFLYVYPGEILINSNVDIYGGLFANDVHITQTASIHYDRNVQRSGTICEELEDPDDDPGDPGDPDAGYTDVGPDPDVGTDPDVGDDPDAGTDPDPVCSSLDGLCTVDLDCCAPLVCSQGTCATVPCAPTNSVCVYHSDCCSGLCATASGESSGICISN